MSIPGLPSLCLASSSGPATSTWQSVGRTASIALEHKKYDEAVRLYRHALEMPKPEDMAFDIDSNLKIALAENTAEEKRLR